MKKTYFILNKNVSTISIPHKMRTADAIFDLVRPGCTVDGSSDYFPEEIKRFENEPDAVAELEKLESFVKSFSGVTRYFVVEEFCVDEVIYEVDEDGEEDFYEFVCSRFSKMPDELHAFGTWYDWDSAAHGGGAYIERGEEK